MVRCPGAVQFFNRGRDEGIKFSGTAGTGFAFFSHLFAPKRIYNFWNSAIKWPIGQVMAISTTWTHTRMGSAGRTQLLSNLRRLQKFRPTEPADFSGRGDPGERAN